MTVFLLLIKGGVTGYVGIDIYSAGILKAIF